MGWNIPTTSSVAKNSKRSSALSCPIFQATLTPLECKTTGSWSALKGFLFFKRRFGKECKFIWAITLGNFETNVFHSDHFQFLTISDWETSHHWKRTALVDWRAADRISPSSWTGRWTKPTQTWKPLLYTREDLKTKVQSSSVTYAQFTGFTNFIAASGTIQVDDTSVCEEKTQAQKTQKRAG